MPTTHDDVASPAAAVAQLRRAGFADARARADLLEHPFTPEGYVGLRLPVRRRVRVRRAGARPARGARARCSLERLRRLPPRELVMRLPIVYATGIRRC